VDYSVDAGLAKLAEVGLAGGFGAVLFSVSFSQQQYIFIQTHSIRG
jgi:hypothetical protein